MTDEKLTHEECVNKLSKLRGADKDILRQLSPAYARALVEMLESDQWRCYVKNRVWAMCQKDRKK